MTAAVEAAEVGYEVILVEKEAYLGGRVIQMNRYFPKMCPPTCGYEINIKRIKRNPRITIYTLAQVENITGTAGDFKVQIKIRPRYVTGDQPINETVIDKLKSERGDDFNYGLSKTKSLYISHPMAYPNTYILDNQSMSEKDLETIKSGNPAGAIDFNMRDKTLHLEIGAVILATGWHPYDAAKLDNLGYGKIPNVITNVMMERYASLDGPTQGKILRPSDNNLAENVAFVQCAGSRDENHLPYCSSVCCMASLKQVRYLRESNENSKATIFYIDIRAVGRFEKFYYDMLDDTNISFIKGKVASVSEDTSTHNLNLDVEDTILRENLHENFDLVILATGMVPNTAGFELPPDFKIDQYGFVDDSTEFKGIYATGCSKNPCDVSKSTKSSTAAALKAIQCLKGRD